MTERLAAPLTAFRQVFDNRDLRRLQLGLAGSVLGQWGYVVALAVYAYDRGGVTLVGVATVARLLPGALFAPLAGALADRHPRRTVLVVGDLARAILLGLAAVGAAAGSPAVVLIAVGLASLAATAFHPARAGLQPSLARTPEELTAANVVGSAIDGAGMFLGPALGGLLLAATSPAVVFAATVGTLLWSVALVSGVPEPPRDHDRAGEAPAKLHHAVREGLAAMVGEARVRVLVGLAAAQTLVAGALTVLIVVVALRLLHRGSEWVGYLEASIGVGGLLGVVAAAGLVGRTRLSPGVLTGFVLFGAPLALIGAFDVPAVVLPAMALIGVGNTVFDVALYTLLQRAVPQFVLARVFGILETVILGCIAIGGVLAPVLIDTLGARGALEACGLFLPVVAIAAARAVQIVDGGAPAPGPALGLLRALPMFAPLPAPVVEALALAARAVNVPAGAEVFAQGDPGDAFYVIAAGALDVTVDGAPVSPLAAGESFGEIALLRDTPRTATITAREPSDLWALARTDFLAAVTGHGAATEAAEHVVASRLARARPALGTL